MKKIFFLILLIFGLGILGSQAQHVRVQIGFPVGISIGAPGPPPYGGAIWIGPEWRWRGGRYEAVPGYWARSRYYGAIWVPGHWKRGRWGYRWEPGHWRR